MEGLPAKIKRIARAEKSWPEKHAKRATVVAAIQLSPEFRQAQLCLARGELTAEALPPAPDATDPSISKRAWERSVQEWRAALRSLVG